MIDYQKILKKNLINVLKDILTNIEKNGVNANNQLYITFLTNNIKNKIPDWLKKEYPSKITIVVQNEYYGLKVKNKCFLISLSFNNIIADLEIFFESVASFADPSANFGLQIMGENNDKDFQKNKKQKSKKRNNVINLANYKKN